MVCATPHAIAANTEPLHIANVKPAVDMKIWHFAIRENGEIVTKNRFLQGIDTSKQLLFPCDSELI